MSTEKNLLLDVARKVISESYSKGTHSTSGGNDVIHWLIQNAANPAIVSYRDKFGNTVLHSLVRDLPFLKNDINLELLLRNKHLERSFGNLVNVKDKEGKIPLDIVLETLFREEEDPKYINDINSNDVSISLKYINYLIVHNSDKQILQKDNILLEMALMCKTDNEVDIFKNILKNLDNTFKKNYINEENLDIALELNAVNNRKGLVYFVNWLLVLYTLKLKKEAINPEIHEEMVRELYSRIPETNEQARDYLNNIRCNVRGEISKNDNFNNFVSDNNNISSKEHTPEKNNSKVPIEYPSIMINTYDVRVPMGPGPR